MTTGYPLVITNIITVLWKHVIFMLLQNTDYQTTLHKHTQEQFITIATFNFLHAFNLVRVDSLFAFALFKKISPLFVLYPVSRKSIKEPCEAPEIDRLYFNCFVFFLTIVLRQREMRRNRPREPWLRIQIGCTWYPTRQSGGELETINPVKTKISTLT